jgi:peptidyl-prolyl cis-trans isomerase A (cyclophilin A)
MSHVQPTRLTITALCLTVVLIGAAVVVGAGDEKATAGQPNPALLDPSLATEKAPDTYKVAIVTTTGDFVIEVHREWAPRGADRFFNLVKIGYYDGVAFYRVIKGFMAQTGMNGDPAVTAAWMNARIKDDPVTQSNTRGKVTFAMSSQPDSRTTQFFINFGDNSYLDASGFAPFGEVVEGYETVTGLFSDYGEGAPHGKGPSQGRLARSGNPYLKGEFPDLDYIVKMTIAE